MPDTTTSDATRQTPLTRALATIRTLRRQLDEQQGGQAVAVIGTGLRLPGGIDGPDDYWTALIAGRDLVGPLPPRRKGPFAAQWEGLPQRGGFLDEVLDFDAAFFGISPREARHLDPQHRLLLEVTWEALENAGVPADRLGGVRTGLYLGIMWQDYREWLSGDPDAYWTTGNGHNFAAGRVAYALGLTGPTVSVDTACSSSLVSVHLAAQALRRGECEIALAAGTNLIMSPRSMRLVQETRSLAPDGLCKTFDARANGFTRGEGCGVVVLKRLDHALRDGDRVQAVIHGSAVNQDGRSGGFTAPNVLSQTALLEQALADARLEPADIGYVEAHGTGTALGDPIEMEALATVLGRRNGDAPLLVGAVKTNLGHLESAAGVAGLIKTMLCLRHRRIPPLLHHRTLNPRIDLGGTRITLPLEPTDWPAGSGRHAGVSSFGMSGTNAHVILGAPDAAPEPAAADVTGFDLSARTPEALRELAARYADRLDGLPAERYPAFAYTATEGRARHTVRARITAGDPAAAAAALRSLAAGEDSPAVHLAPPTDLPALPRQVLDLPSYPWQRQRYEPENRTAGPADGVADTALPTMHRLVWQDHTPAEPSGAEPLVLAGDDVRTLHLLAAEAAARGHRGTVLCDHAPALPGGWDRAELPAGRADWAAHWAARSAPATLVLAFHPGPRPTVSGNADATATAPALAVGDAHTDADAAAPASDLAVANADATAPDPDLAVSDTYADTAAPAPALAVGDAYTDADAVAPDPDLAVSDTNDDATAPAPALAVGDAHTDADAAAPASDLAVANADATAPDPDLAVANADTAASAPDPAVGDTYTDADTAAPAPDPVGPAALLCAAVTDAVAAAEAAGARVHAVTRGVRRTTDEEPAAAGPHAALHGLAPVLGLEFAAGWGGVVDLPAEPEPADAAALLALVTGEDRTEDLAAVRGGTVRVPRIVPADGTPAARPAPHEDATYLVTGALGAVGRELTAELVRRGARHLLLIGRRAASELGDEARAFLGRLADDGVRAVYRGGGCDTAEALADACTALAGMPPVRGVVHAAGTLTRTPAAGLTADGYAAELRGKAAGAWWLHRASAGWPLDFFVLVSSVSALWGTEGCAAYSAANGMLDALAAHRTSLGLPAASLGFGPWTLTGAGSGGMADGELLERSARLGVGSFDAATGRAALTTTAPGPEGHLVVCPLDLERLRTVMSGLRPRGVFGGEPAPAARAPREPSAAARLLALPERARAAAARTEVARLLADQLGHARAEDIDETTGFLDLGLDSITAVDLAARLGEAFGSHVPAGDVFDHPTVARLADHLLARLNGAVAAHRAPAPRPGPPAAPPPARTAPAAPEPAAAGSTEPEPVAIVGMAGRFPRADSVEELWELLREGRDGITAVPEDRDALAGLSGGPSTTDQGGFLRDLDRFDAAFFGIPAREAENLDPQQRLLLESAWHALEDGGIDPERLRSTRTGVFVGISYADYARLLADGGPDKVDAYYSTGTALNAAAGRIAYTFGLTGPAVAVDTACSSSLVAVHLAVRSLRSGESETALAGGVNVLLDRTSWTAVSRAHMLSPGGRCRTFSADADGFARSEACGVLVLKRLADARRDGDRVYAVIRGSAMNQDGASSGLTAPNGAAQEEMLRAALADARIAPGDVSYLEAHGTGTSLGDPIEIGAAWRVLGEGRGPGRTLRTGSVKSNLGHCESAAGVVSLIKTVLALRHELIPGNLHFKEPNPHVAWSEMDVRVVDAATPWRRAGGTRIAGVSGFGFTGTNAHVLLSDPPAPAPEPARPADEEPARPAGEEPPGPAGEEPPVCLLPLSAPDEAGLDRLTAAWEQALSTADDTDLPRLAAVAGAGRGHFPYRRALLGRDREQMLRALRETAPSRASARAPRVAFLFSGQGSQYFGMGRELYETEPVFREVFDRCDAVLAPRLGASLTELMFYGEDRQAINETRCTQPALVTLQTALAALWESWGVTPAVVMGHSVGEISAAVQAGVMDLDTGLALIAERARLMQASERGAMLAVVADEERASSWAREHGLDVAAVNGPESIVLAGAPDAVDALAAALRDQGVRARRLSVSHAFHSRLLDPAVERLGRALAPLAFRDPDTPVISNVTGRLAEPGEYDAQYWCRHARRPVRFHDGIRSLAGLGVDVCLEIGPDRTLVNLVKGAGLAPAGGLASSLRRGTGERAALLDAARVLYLAGRRLDWERVQPGTGTVRAAAPRYPFADTRYWAPVRPDSARPAAAQGPAWGTRLSSPALHGRVWATERTPEYPAHLTDHRLFGVVSVPGASQTATALSALGSDGGRVVLEDLHFPRALVLRDDERYPVQVIEAEQEHGTRTVSVQSLVDVHAGRWQEHLAARVVPAPAVPDKAAPDPAAFITGAERHLSGADFYRHLRTLGYHLGPSFRWIGEVWLRGDEALVRYDLPDDPREDPAGWEIHPGLLDSLLQSAVTFAVAEADPDSVTEEAALAIPFAVARLDFCGRPASAGQLWGHIRATGRDREADGLMRVSAADLRLFGDGGTTVLTADGFRFRRAPRALLERSLRDTPPLAYELVRVEREFAAAPAGTLRVALLGGGDTGRRLAETFEALGHQVVDAGPAPAPGAVPDLVIDARFATAEGGADEALRAALALTEGLRTAAPGVPYAVLGGTDPAAAPVRETLWGLLAALEAEQPERRLLRLALTPDADPATVAATLAALVAGRDAEAPVEIAGTTVRVTRLAPCDGTGSAPGHPGAVLITGGLGALGLSTAGFLARLGAPAVTLMGRSAPDAAARAVIAELSGRGIAVQVVQGDVTDPADCRRAVAEAARTAPLGTALHLAGTAADGAFEHLTADSYDRVFAAKARGAVHLAEALAGHPDARLLLFSSASTVLGSAGQVNYAAANGFLDGLAERLRAEGVRATTVDWGPWTPDAKQGMAGSAATAQAIARLGIRALGDAEAEEPFRLALDGDRARLLAVGVDAARFTELRADGAAALFTGLVRRPPASRDGGAEQPAEPRGWLREQLAGSAADSREERLRQAIRELAGSALGAPLHHDDDLGFTECGLDSIMVIDLRTRLAHALAEELPATVALDHPTVAQLAAHTGRLLFPGQAAGEAPREPAEEFPELAGLSFDELVRAVQADVSEER